MQIHISAVGRMKSGPLLDLCKEYQKRLLSDIILKEIEYRSQLPAPQQKEKEAQLLQASLPSSSYIIALDERGKTLSSQDFTGLIDQYSQKNSHERLCFIIGGADGLSQNLIHQARHVLSFGRMTWPHMMARVMLLEQLYRAQQILKGHPYHRE